MSLDSGARSLEADTLNDIRVQGSLQQPFNSSFLIGTRLLCFIGSRFDLGSLGFKDVDESVSDDFTFLFGILDVLKARKEKVRGVNDGEVYAEIFV